MSASAIARTVGPKTRTDLAPVIAVLHGPSMPALVGPNGEQVVLPVEVFHLLRDVVDALEQGKGVTIAPQDAVMTTQQAADFLGVSRPTLVKFLEAGRIAFEKPGRHRRVKLADLLAFQERLRAERRAALDEITSQETQAGIRPDGFVATR